MVRILPQEKVFLNKKLNGKYQFEIERKILSFYNREFFATFLR